jgi:hypothetical protein
MQKTFLFSLQIGTLLANTLNSIGYTDKILFLALTIGKSDIFQHKSLGKRATDFDPNIRKPETVTNKY